MAEEQGSPDDAVRPEDSGSGFDRRTFLTRAGVGTAIAWTAPTILSQPAFAAASGTPPTTQPPPFTHPFVAVGGDGSGRTFTTDDFGATWPVNTTPVASGEVHAVAWGPIADTWIAVGRNGSNATILTSTDTGQNWSVNATSPVGRLLDVATDGLGNWVAVGEANPSGSVGPPLILFSGNNGATWAPAAPPAGVNDLHGLATDGAGNWIAAGSSVTGNPILTISTTNGATWGASLVLGPPGVGHVFDVASGSGGAWLAVGSTASAGNDFATIWFVQPGNPFTAAGNWNPIPPAPGPSPWGTGRFSGVTSNNGANFVGVGTHDPSGPGFTFSFASSATPGAFAGPAPRQLHGVATDQAGNWLAVGQDPGGNMAAYLSTNNGVNWAPTTSPSGGLLLGASARVVA